MTENSLYATPKNIIDINLCYFYHTMDIPGYGVVHGEWDLRTGFREYLGGVNFHGKRVLELGTASGFLCFKMEQMGAEIVAHDLSEQQSWDIIPYYHIDHRQALLERKSHIQKLNNGYWFAHQAFKSNAKVLYCSIYEIPEQLGMVDISTFGSILLHVRDPFLALHKALALTKDTVIVTDVAPAFYRLTRFANRMLFQKNLFSRFVKPYMEFLPNFRKCEPTETWWHITPDLIAQFIGILGFEDIQCHYHKQLFQGREILLYTVVGRRTKETPLFNTRG